MKDSHKFIAECVKCKTAQEPSNQCKSCGEKDPLKLNNIVTTTLFFEPKKGFILRDSIVLILISIPAAVFLSILFNGPIDDGIISSVSVISILFVIALVWILLKSWKRAQKFSELSIKAKNLMQKDLGSFSDIGEIQKNVATRLGNLDWEAYYFNKFSNKNITYASDIKEEISESYRREFMQYNHYNGETLLSVYPWLENNNGDYLALLNYLKTTTNYENNSVRGYLDLVIINNRCSRTKEGKTLLQFHSHMKNLKSF